VNPALGGSGEGGMVIEMNERRRKENRKIEKNEG